MAGAITGIISTFSGVTATIQGPIAISEGSFRRGLTETFMGLTLINWGARCLNIGGSLRQGILKYSLLGGIAAVARGGISRCFSGYKNKNYLQMIKGTAQAALGLVGSAYIASVDSKVIAALQESLLFALPSGYVAYSGVGDVVHKRYVKGVCKVLLGGCGVACSAYYFYSSQLSPEHVYHQMIASGAQMPPEVNDFLQAHQSEVSAMNQDKYQTGDWERLDSGVSKIVYTHPELPGYIVKIPLENESYWGGRESDIILHIRNAVDARKIIEANHYSHIAIPQSYLTLLIGTPIAVEEKFDFVPFWSVSGGLETDRALHELRDFLDKAEICDVDVYINHNAGFLKDTETPKIGVFDLDCKGPQFS